MMDILKTPETMRQWSAEAKRSGKTVCLVPTMGFFHEGHLSLMRRGAELCDLVVVSLFVNPTQFGPNEDLDRYPRAFERDCALLEREPVAVLFAPAPERMYPLGFQTEVRVTGLSTHLCGASRPGHFTGVATVLCKLFNIVCPDAAVFGEKDFQQLSVIRRFVADLNIPVRIVGHPIVREADGLAMSSRNSYLDPDNRAAALSLSSGLELARTRAADGERSAAALSRAVEEHIRSFTATEIDYVRFVDCDSLEPVETVDARTVLAMAVRVDGKVRLIDNGFVMPQARN